MKKIKKNYLSVVVVNNKGFTLFELLVTISIIAVLTAVAVVSYGGLNKKARDSRRMADIEKIRISLEAARQIGYTYPEELNHLKPVYLDQVPKDPKLKEDYKYERLTNHTYRICGFMEDVGSTSSVVLDCRGLPSGYVGYYRVVNP